MDGKNAASIKSVDKIIEGYGTLMQSANADKFIGKRIRLSGYIKSQNVSEKAGFWLRIGQANSQSFLAFDSMMDRAVTGTTDWKKYEIVLDVPEGLANFLWRIASRNRQIWFDKLNFEIVDTNVPTTGKKADRVKVKDEPMNLDFEE